MTKRRKILANTALILASTVVAFLLLEAAARLVLRYGNDPERFLTYASARQLRMHPEFTQPYMRFQAHRYLGYIPTPNFRRHTLTHNALGYKDDEIVLPKPDGEFRIVCMGGSTTYTTIVGDTALSYPNLLEQDLHDRGLAHVNVVNAGVDGYTSYETLINYAFRVQDLEPDMLIIMDGLNDTYARIVWPPEAFKGDNSGFRAPLFDSVIMPSVLEYSTLLRVVLIKAGLAESHFGLRTMYDLAATDSFYGAEWERQQATGTYPDGIFKQVDLARMLDECGPQFFIRNIENVIAMAKYHGIEVVLLSTPWARADTARPGDRPILSNPACVSALEDAARRMETLAHDTGCLWFDLAQRFPDDPDCYVDGVHMNIDGARIKANLIADFLLDSHPLGPHTTP